MEPNAGLTKADIAFHDVTADVYEETLDSYFRAYNRLTVLPWLRSLPHRTTGRDALDLGCGTGVMALRLAERGFRVQGIDHSEGMLKIARATAERRGLATRVELRQGDGRDLPYDSGRFDVVTCQGVLHHLDDMRPCVAEIARVLKPGGVFYIADPCEGSTPASRSFARLGRLRDRFARGGRGYMWSSGASGEPVPDHDEAPISAPALASMLRELGLEVRLAYWSTFAGMRHVRPLRLQEAAIFTLSTPWKNRAGDLVIASGRKPMA